MLSGICGIVAVPFKKYIILIGNVIDFIKFRECQTALSRRYKVEEDGPSSGFRLTSRETGGDVGWRSVALVKLQNRNRG